MKTLKYAANPANNKIWPFITIAGIVIYVIIDIILAFLRPDYSPLRNAESDYGRGPYFWLMDINFLLRCAFSLALVAALMARFPKNIRMEVAAYWLGLWAIASGLLAFFADNPYGYPHLSSGGVHLLLAFIAFISVLVAMFSLNRQLMATEIGGKPVFILTSLTAIAVIAIILLGHSGFKPHTLGGLYERIFLAAVLAWEAVVAYELAFVSNPKVHKSPAHPARRAKAG